MSTADFDLIFLNGSSSAGKTSLCRCLQELLLPKIYLGYSIDTILYCLPASALKRMTTGQDISDLEYPKLVQAYYDGASSLLKLGHRLIMDDSVIEAEFARQIQERFQGMRVLKVGLHCGLDELKRRELARGDRAVGTVEWEFPRVHKHLAYDLEVDSSTSAPKTLALTIMKFMAGHPAP